MLLVTMLAKPELSPSRSLRSPPLTSSRTPEVVAEADYTGSTSGIVDWIHQHKPKKAMLVTECSMAANIADALPDVDFAKPCNMCPYMKKITLEKVLFSLHSMTTQVEVDAEVGARARIAVERMIDLSRSLAR